MRPGVHLDLWSRAVTTDYCIIFACLMLMTSATIMGDECDWTGSGLSFSSGVRGVTPVYLRCAAGRVTWLYPRGALRVLLRLPSHQDREFRACIKVRPDKHKGLPVRIFLEGPRSLLPLYSHDDGSSKPVRCFNSKYGQAAIYVEAIEADSVIKRTATIDYDLQPLPRGARGYDPTEECRPCTHEELAHAFCTSDLVTRGIIRGVENRDDLEVSQMTVRITKLIRHAPEDSYTRELESNEISSDGDGEVVVQVPRHCGVTYGTGEFVFMARRKLGDLVMRCAPRLEEWAAVANLLTQEGRAHCVLRS